MNGDVQVSDVSIALLAVRRDPIYIHQTLASLFCSGRAIYDVASIEVFVDGSDDGYLREYKDNRLLRIHYLNEQERQEQSRRHIWSRFCHNYCRCLNLGVRRGLIVLEDDVVVRENFLPCLVQAVSEIDNVRGLDQYLLSLHSKLNLHENPANDRGHYHIRYPAGEYYGTQGIYYPAAIRQEIHDHIYEHGVRHYRRQGDLLIKDLMRSRQVLFNTAWDLVEHIGEISTGLGKGRAWLSPTFKHPWIPLEPILGNGHTSASPEMTPAAKRLELSLGQDVLQ